jgi:hypothetical protein
MPLGGTPGTVGEAIQDRIRLIGGRTNRDARLDATAARPEDFEIPSFLFQAAEEEEEVRDSRSNGSAVAGVPDAGVSDAPITNNID